MAVMRWTFADLYGRFLAKAYSSPGTDETTEAKQTVNDGYLMFLSEREWTFLRQPSSQTVIAYDRTITPANVEIDDVFAVELEDAAENSYEIEFTATAATVANVVTGLYDAAVVAAAAADAPWNLVTVTDDTTHLTITPDSIDMSLSATTTATDGGGADTQTLTDAAVSKEGVIALPANFGELTGDVIITTIGYRTPPRLEWRSPEWIREYVQTSRQTPGVPLYYTVQESTFVTTTGSRRELRLAPWPNADYTLSVPYRIEPTTMTADAEYPVGAAVHGATILAAAFAVWEERTGKTDGVMHGLYHGPNYPREIGGALARSIRRDGQQRARILGPTPRKTQPIKPLRTITYATD